MPSETSVVKHIVVLLSENWHRYIYRSSIHTYRDGDRGNANSLFGDLDQLVILFRIAQCAELQSQIQKFVVVYLM